tara:strand:- start:166 stop:480 length:315 start_codon:yes stop_codon:yes gene_type:complete
MKYKSINYVTNYLTDILNNECNVILEKLSEDFPLNYDNLKETYLNDTSQNTIKNQQQIKTIVDSNIRCLGIIKSGAQCARTRTYGCDYCKIHQKTLKFGRKILT